MLGLRISNFAILGFKISNFTKFQILQKSPNFIKKILNITNFVGSRYEEFVLHTFFPEQVGNLSEANCKFKPKLSEDFDGPMLLLLPKNNAARHLNIDNNNIENFEERIHNFAKEEAFTVIRIPDLSNKICDIKNFFDKIWSIFVKFGVKFEISKPLKLQNLKCLNEEEQKSSNLDTKILNFDAFLLQIFCKKITEILPKLTKWLADISKWLQILNA